MPKFPIYKIIATNIGEKKLLPFLDILISDTKIKAYISDSKIDCTLIVEREIKIPMETF